MTMERGRGVSNTLFTTTCTSPLSLFHCQCTCKKIDSPVKQNHIVIFFLLFVYSERR